MSAQSGKYQILARRYRPQLFSEVCGQEAVVTTLKNALSSGRLAYAYIFSGTRGTGKTTLARLFAKALNCAALTEEGEPCNQCQSCREIIQGNSLDVLEIDGASNRGIDDIRQMTETVGYAPAHGKFKIYIIDEVHMLTKEAFNALLKTLEEPPSHVKFFFATTELHKVLPTIVSRCQRFDLKRIPPSTISSKLLAIAKEQNATIDEEALRLVVRVADGSLRDAESLLDQLICSSSGQITADIVHFLLGLTPQTYYFRLDQAILEKKPSAALNLIEELSLSGKDLGHFLEGLLEHFRILLLALWKRPLPIMSEEDEKTYREHASHMTEVQCMNLLERATEFWQQAGKTPFKKIFLEMFLMQIIRNSNAPSYAELVQRLAALEDSVDLSSPPQPVARAPEIPTPPRPIEPKVQAQEIQPEQPAPVEIQNFEEKNTQDSVKAVAPEQITTPSTPSVPSSRYETLMRFAAVELEGSLTN